MKGPGFDDVAGARQCAMVGDDALDRFAERLLVRGEIEIHRQAPRGRPRWRPEIMLSCTSAAPAAMPAVIAELNCARRSEEHTSELQSLMPISAAVFCLKKKQSHKCPSHFRYPPM